MTPTEIIERVYRAIDALIAVADGHDGLFPSIIDRSSHRMVAGLPPAIEGQRDGDRAHLGSNLIHDEAILSTMLGVDRQDYARAADRYLRRFASHCTDTESGLFPWGEHAYWHLAEGRPGNSFDLTGRADSPPLIHDHLRSIPLWLWEKLQAHNPRCVERFGEGLDNHWVDVEPLEYIRHAYVDRVSRQTPGRTSCDFPRHSGFYIWDWSVAYARTERAGFLGQIQAMLDYWWEKREPDGLCWTESRTHPEHILHRMKGIAQTLSLGTSLLEAAGLIAPMQPQMAATMRERAATYTAGFLAAPHQPDRGLFLNGCHADTGEPSAMAVWGSVYGRSPASYTGLLCLCNYRISQDPRLLEWAQAVGQCYLEEPFPSDLAVPAMDTGMGLGLLADLYELTGQDAWLAGGLDRTELIVELYFGDRDLPAGASSIDWYESQMGPSFLIHGLARLALLAIHGRDCPLPPDYTGR